MPCLVRGLECGLSSPYSEQLRLLRSEKHSQGSEHSPAPLPGRPWEASRQGLRDFSSVANRAVSFDLKPPRKQLKKRNPDLLRLHLGSKLGRGVRQSCPPPAPALPSRASKALAPLTTDFPQSSPFPPEEPSSAPSSFSPPCTSSSRPAARPLSASTTTSVPQTLTPLPPCSQASSTCRQSLGLKTLMLVFGLRNHLCSLRFSEYSWEGIHSSTQVGFVKHGTKVSGYFRKTSVAFRILPPYFREFV